jgi:hypothetical protein
MGMGWCWGAHTSISILLSITPVAMRETGACDVSDRAGPEALTEGLRGKGRGSSLNVLAALF